MHMDWKSDVDERDFKATERRNRQSLSYSVIDYDKICGENKFSITAHDGSFNDFKKIT